MSMRSMCLSPNSFIEEGTPVANATHKSLVDGSTLESAARLALHARLSPS